MLIKIQISLIQFKMARLLLNLTQGDVSNVIGMTRANYNRIENHKSNPKSRTARNIINFYAERGIIFHKDGNVTLKKVSNSIPLLKEKSMSKLKPIETAPKDGTHFVGFNKDKRAEYFICFRGDKEWFYSLWECQQRCSLIEVEPTHWLPLPGPKKSLVGDRVDDYLNENKEKKS